MTTECATCGAAITSKDARFCSKCGKAVLPQLINLTATDRVKIPFWKRDIGDWVLFFLLAILFTMFFSTLYSGNKLSTNEIASAAFWPGIAGAYILRKQKRNGWAGFGIGVAAGLFGLLVLAVIAGTLRSLSGAAS